MICKSIPPGAFTNILSRGFLSINFDELEKKLNGEINFLEKLPI